MAATSPQEAQDTGRGGGGRSAVTVFELDGQPQLGP